MCVFHIDLFILAEGVELVRIGHNENDDIVFGRVAVNPGLPDELRLNEDVLEFFGCDVLALHELEDVFCSIDDPNAAIWSNLGDIA